MNLPAFFFLCCYCCSSHLLAQAAQPVASRAELATGVREAIDKGKAELLRRMESLLKNAPSDYPIGRVALPTAALLKSGVALEEPRIQAAITRLETLRPEKTYCIACNLILLDSIAHAKGDNSTVRARMCELANQLVAAQTPHQGGWSYEKGTRRNAHDFSNVQFAALGLQIAQDHGISLPDDMFASLALLLVGAMTTEGEPEPGRVSVEAPLEARLGLTRVSTARVFRAAPGGWGYTDPRKGKADHDKPYASMTAAGVSSLAIALNALRKGRLASQPSIRKLIQQGDRALESGYVWISNRFDEFVSDRRELYYALYSLEKAGDLCKVECFGSHDWYAEGAMKLIEKQRMNGGWGTYVDTSLALLFLTRATRRIEAVAPPAILTGDSGKPPASNRDLVFIAGAKGFISVFALLEYVSATRKPALLPICEEAVRNYAPDWKDELVPHLLRLWAGSDRVTDFAKRALAEITGVEQGSREAFAQWEKERVRALALEARADLDSSTLSRAILELQAPRVKSRLVSLAQRRDWRNMAGLLVAELETPSLEYRRRLHGVLTLWSDSAVAIPLRDTAAAWAEVVKAWRDWWTLHSKQWEARYGAPQR